MSYERRDDLEPDSIECIWVEVLCKNAKNFLICCVYRPPDLSNYLDKNFNNYLSNMLSIATAERKEVTILGDVNVNYLCKNDNKEFKDIMALYGFQQMVKQATRICESTETLIDIISTNNPESMKCTKVVPCSFRLRLDASFFAV